MRDNNSMSDYVAEELRAMIARRRISGRQLAEQVGMSQSAMSARLTGATEIGLNDIERIAAALGVEVADLLPTTERRESTRYSHATPTAANDTAQPEVARPGHAAPTLTGRPTSWPIARPSGTTATAARDRRPARLHTRHTDSHRQ